MTQVRAEGRAGATPSAGAARSSCGWAAAARRLARRYAESRRVPVALAVLAASGVVMRAALAWQWIPRTGSLTQQLPVVLEAGVASVVAMTLHDPFGEVERASGRWLPYLRLGAAVALTGIAVGLLAAGGAAAHLPGGTLDVVRNVGGIVGIGLLSAAAVGGGLSWIGPMAYLVLSEAAILSAWRTPWIWPARSPDDVGAALCATLAFVAGTAIITVRGPRQRWAGAGPAG